MGQVGLHHSGVSGVQAGSLGLHQYIQLPLFQQQDFLTGMDHRQVAVLAVGFQLKAYDQRLRYKISVGHGRKQMIPYIGIGLGEDQHIRLTGCQAGAALTSHKQIGGDVQSGAEFAQGGQGRVGEIALDLGDIPDGQTSLFGQFLEGDSPLFPDISNMFAQHKTSRFFVKNFIYSISQNALYVNKQEKIRYL